MEVTVKFFATYREVTGEGQISVSDVSTVKELLDRLVVEFGEKMSNMLFESQGKLRDSVNVLVNGRAIVFLDGLETKLNRGDSVAIFPPISGGQDLITLL